MFPAQGAKKYTIHFWHNSDVTGIISTVINVDETSIAEDLLENLRCPVCRGELRGESLRFVCAAADCGAVFPIIGGVPVLINDGNSLFSVADFVERRDTTYHSDTPKWKRAIRRMLPDISKNYNTDANFRQFAETIKKNAPTPKILIVGGAVAGKNLDVDALFANAQIVESDVAFGARANLIADAHDLPFADAVFDGVIAQAVLEHTIDPQCCVDEMRRVLKSGGAVYAETPFMQQVHAGRFDFTRFTHLGHRRLFRGFDEIKSGAVCGAGMSLAWSWAYFLHSFCRTKQTAQIAFAAASLTAFWLKYFDYFTIDRAGTFDAASGYYFLGEKSDRMLSDRDLIAGYKGLI